MAAIIAASVAAAATIGSAAMSSSAASSAAETQADAARLGSEAEVKAAQIAADTQRYFYDQTRTDQAPYRQAGQVALNQLTRGTRPGGQFMEQFGRKDFQTDPGYQFRLAEGMKALDRSAASKGNLFSGRQLLATQRYGQDFASNEYTNAFNRFQTEQTTGFNRLATLAGIGQTSVNTLGGVGNSTAARMGEAQMTAGQARASGYYGVGNATAAGALAQGNIWGGAAQGLSRGVSDYVMLNSLMQQQQPQGGATFTQYGNNLPPT